MLAVSLAVAAAAFALEIVVGYPARLLRAAGHPVMAMGAVIDRLDAALNDEAASFEVRRRRGAVALVVLVALFGAPALALSFALRLAGPAGWLAEAALASSLLASKSLHDHVAEVDRALEDEGIEAGRRAVAKIVGRETAALDAAAVRRAAIESLAENYSDGVIAPLVWLALFGLPGIVVYKAVNTADSMIGHRTPRHEAFGWAAARTDDGLNLIPARLTALLIALVSGRPGAAVSSALRDARRHRSPNAGWPEAAMAGAVGVRLSGPRSYGGAVSDEPWVNAAGGDPDAASLRRAVRITGRVTALALTLVLIAAAAGLSLS